MLKQQLQLLHLIGDGGFHDIDTLAANMAATPQAVSALLSQLDDDGFVVRVRNETEYALDMPVDWLSEGSIREYLEPIAAQCFKRIEVLDSVDSTSRWLAQCPPPEVHRATVCMAESQSAGRGRLGRTWVSPPAVNLYLSLNWRFEAGPEVVQGLSLALGVALAEACENLGIPGVGLKWPNDLVCTRGKLGGILIELGRDGSAGVGPPVCAIIGIGINANRSSPQSQVIDQPAADLNTLKGGQISRNRLAGEVLNKTHQVLAAYMLDGFAPYRERWLQRDIFLNQQVEISGGSRTLAGTAIGIDERGAYLVHTADGTLPIMSGTVRLSSGQ